MEARGPASPDGGSNPARLILICAMWASDASTTFSVSDLVVRSQRSSSRRRFPGSTLERCSGEALFCCNRDAALSNAVYLSVLRNGIMGPRVIHEMADAVFATDDHA